MDSWQRWVADAEATYNTGSVDQILDRGLRAKGSVDQVVLLWGIVKLLTEIEAALHELTAERNGRT